jgi:hypothetical protein
VPPPDCHAQVDDPADSCNVGGGSITSRRKYITLNAVAMAASTSTAPHGQQLTGPKSRPQRNDD